MPQGKKEEQEIEYLFEKIREYFPDLVKEIDIQEIQEAQRVPKKLDPMKHTPRHIIIILPKIKHKERILEAATKRTQLPTKDFPEDCQLISPKKPYRQEGARKKYLKS